MHTFCQARAIWPNAWSAPSGVAMALSIPKGTREHFWIGYIFIKGSYSVITHPLRFLYQHLAMANFDGGQ
jgi:hypothetical protein